MHRIRLGACSLAVTAAFAAPAFAAPTVSWSQPTSNEVLKGSVSRSNCYVSGSRIRQVRFYVVNSSGQSTLVTHDTASGWNCEFDSRKFPDGNYTMRAVAYDGSGATATANRSVKISNGNTGGGSEPPPPSGGSGNTPPTLSITAPQAGATWKGYVNSSMCGASATDSDGIQKVEFFLNDKLVKSDGTNPYQCNVETTLYKDGTYQLIVKATDRKGGVSTAQREVKIANGGGSTPPPPPPPTTGGAIDGADILTVSLSDTPFSQQSGYNGQVLGTYPSVQSIPESGIHGSTMSNGESLRMGKQADPANSSRKAIVFALAPNDPNTSGSKRSEFKFPNNMDFGSTYWTAFRMFIPDWGTLSSSDEAVFATQLHSGDSAAGYPPAFALTAVNQGRNLRVRVRGSGLSAKDLAVIPIPFGRWVDFVFKVRQSTGSDGLLQVWMDGQLVGNHQGPIGYKTSYKDYMKYGYYNYSSGFNTPRKIMMRQIILLRDPTGSKYSPETLRAFANQ